MRKLPLIFPALIILFICPVVIFGQDSKQPQWYEIIGGVLAIPVTLIGIAYSYILIKKTNLESKKIELEIKEKENVLIEKGVTQSEEVKNLVKPFVRTEIIHQIILRFIILELLRYFFSVFAGGYSFLLVSLNMTLNNFFFSGYNSVSNLLFSLLQFLPQLGYALIFIAIGYPLFKDVNKILGIDIKKVFLSPFKQKEHIIE